MSILCKLFGHKPQEGVWSGAEYMRLGNWGTTDGIGREHVVLLARCARCSREYTAGKLHRPAEWTPMSTYTVTVHWLERDERHNFCEQQGVIGAIKATSLHDACVQALSQYKDKLCLGVTSAYKEPK